MVVVSDWDGLEFLSKVPHMHDGKLVLTRNYTKRLTAGFSYSGSNRYLLHCDILHQAALL